MENGDAGQITIASIKKMIVIIFNIKTYVTH